MATPGTWRSFAVPPLPGGFVKTSPANGVVGQPTNPALSWGASANAASYEYCVNTSASCSSWVSTGSVTGVTLSGKTPGIKYYWQVRAVNAMGLAYADGGSATSGWYAFTILPLPTGFNKIGPANGAVGQPTNPTLSWGASGGAVSYEYCISTTTSCTSPAAWTTTGTTTSAALSGLTPGVKYYWQVRSANSVGYTYANGSSGSWWYFTIQPKPGAFNKASPVNNAVNQSKNPTLGWGISSSAASYEYCLDTGVCTDSSTWITNGTTTSVALSGLTPGLKYYWQVRAVNVMGITYANGGSSWSFTVLPLPGPFSLTSPGDGASNQPANPVLRWGASSGAASYSYCIDTNNDDACNASWISTGASTSRSLGGLVPGSYYWLVRATNASGVTDANAGSWFSFTVPPLPGGFVKTSPANGVVGQPTNPALSWGASANAASYEYCVNTSASCSSWVSTGSVTGVTLSGKTPGIKYYWQVRAVNAMGLAYADGGSATSGWYAFTILPLPTGFNKIGPANGAVGQPTNPTLSWGASGGAVSYEYCISTTTSCTSPAAWTTTGTTTSAALSGLTPGVKYYWQVRSANSVGYTYANGSSGSWWYFTIQPKPGAFNKASPVNNAVNQSKNPTLSWGISSSAASYEYCLDTGVCTDSSTWITNGTTTSVALSGLTPGLKYYWQVRAVNVMGITYANGGSSWSFTVLPLPGPFSLTSPGDGASNQPANPVLRWGASSGAASYSYCIDTNNDDACNASWISTGASTSRSLGGLVPGSYYWLVRATNASGVTDANAGSWFSFTVPPLPGGFVKTSPANGVVGQPTNPALSWGASANAASYEYCVNTAASCSSWISTGSVTGVTLSGKTPGIKYYWQVRAVNAMGLAYADGGSATSGWYAFTILPLPTGFNKIGPANGAVGQPTNPTLSWGASGGAVSYEYCISTTTSCTSPAAWTTTGTTTSAALSGLTPGVKYYWQVRSANSVGYTYANGSSGSWWYFREK